MKFIGEWRFAVHIELVREACVLLTVAVLTLEASAEEPVNAAVAADLPGISVLQTWLAAPLEERRVDAPGLRIALSEEESAASIQVLHEERLARLAAERKGEIENKSLSVSEKSLRWQEKTYGDEPADGWSLWISLHGGGAAPQVVNDQQWRNQAHLYKPAEGIYVAPRAPTDTWNLWHEGHIDPMFQRIIENYVAVRGVNPNKVYLLGYSAGGDGVWQLAPRMADRFAAAAMMAGHPNDASLEGLRNLPFAIFMGGNDGAYNRHKVAAEKTRELDRLEQEDPGGYVHMSRIYEGLGHWMNGKDAEALPWMAGFKRNPWPKKIVWVQDDVFHDRFYWLKIPDKSSAKEGRKIIATVDGQTIRLTGEIPKGMTLLLSDALVDLDEPVSVLVNEKTVSTAKLPRTAAIIRQCLEERLDSPATATARFVVP
jgi:predicted esterase